MRRNIRPTKCKEEKVKYEKRQNMSELHFMKMSTPIWNFRQLKLCFNNVTSNIDAKLVT